MLAYVNTRSASTAGCIMANYPPIMYRQSLLLINSEEEEEEEEEEEGTCGSIPHPDLLLLPVLSTPGGAQCKAVMQTMLPHPAFWLHKHHKNP